MATDLGKVGMRMRGDWNSSTAYEVLDAVSYNGGLYIAKQAVPANTLPTNTTYWQVGITRNLTNISETRFNFTSSTTLDYTGLSITIPKNSNYSLSVSAVYASSNPLELAIAANSSALAPHTMFFKEEVANGSISGRTGSSPLTLYVWARYGSAASNYLLYSGWYES